MNDEKRDNRIHRAHARAMLKVSTHLEKGVLSVLKNFLIDSKAAPCSQIQPQEEFQEIARILINGGQIRLGEYELLKGFFEQVGQSNLVEILNSAKQEISKLSETAAEKAESMKLNHADLKLEFERIILPRQLESLKSYFRAIYGNEAMKHVDTSFIKLWEELEKRHVISPGNYDKLENALRSFQATSHVQIIRELQEKMKSEDGRYDTWIKQDIHIGSVADLLQKKDLFSGALKDGQNGILFKNAAMVVIGEQGGKLRLRDGTVMLDIPPGAVDQSNFFWILSGDGGCPQFADVKLANEPVACSNGVVKYSIRVRLGPSGVDFKFPVRLTVANFSKPPSGNGSPSSMSVYCKADGDTEWKRAGSCFYDADYDNNFTASVSLNHFSSYVLGMPVSSDLLLLNVRAMVQVKTDAQNAEKELQVFFTVNDYSLSKELVLNNRISVESATCLYLDPSSDVSVTRARRYAVEKVKIIMKEVINKQHIQHLVEKPVFLSLAAAGGFFLAERDQTDDDYEDILILEQNETELVELPLLTRAKREFEIENETIVKTRDQDESERVQKLHYELCITLEMRMTARQLTLLMHYFRNHPFTVGELESMNTLLDLWLALERRGMIKTGSYSPLEAAFRALGESSHFFLIRQFQERMRSDGDIYNGWIIDKQVIDSKEKLLQRIALYRQIMEDGSRGIVFRNAVVRLVGREGGTIQLNDGSAKLEVPPQAIDKEETFWILRPSPKIPQGMEQFHYCSASAANDKESDGIVKYSLPVWLGPEGVKFRVSVLLTLRDFNLPDTTGGRATTMNVYRKSNDDCTWEAVGSCFCETDSLTVTARFTLSCFSGYILGVPVSDSPRPVNVNILVQTNDSTSDKNTLKVFFIINVFSYIEEFIEHNKITVACKTCLFLAAESDVTVTWRRHMDGSLERTAMEARLPKQSIQNLAERPVFLEIDPPAVEGSKEFHYGNAYDDVLFLEQNDKVLLELPFDRNDALSSDETVSMLTSRAAATARDQIMSSQLEQSASVSNQVEERGLNP